MEFPQLNTLSRWGHFGGFSKPKGSPPQGSVTKKKRKKNTIFTKKKEKGRGFLAFYSQVLFWERNPNSFFIQRGIRVKVPF